MCDAGIHYICREAPSGYRSTNDHLAGQAEQRVEHATPLTKQRAHRQSRRGTQPGVVKELLIVHLFLCFPCYHRTSSHRGRKHLTTRAAVQSVHRLTRTHSTNLPIKQLGATVCAPPILQRLRRGSTGAVTQSLCTTSSLFFQVCLLQLVIAAIAARVVVCY